MQKKITPDFPTSGLVRPIQVMEYLGIPRTTFYRWIRQGLFPKGKKWGGTSVWDAEEVRSLVRDLRGPCADSRIVVTQ